MLGRCIATVAAACLLVAGCGFYGRRGDWNDVTAPDRPTPLLSDRTNNVPHDDLFIYKVGNGDGLRLTVTGHEEFSGLAAVDQRGKIAVPGTHDVLDVGGLALDEVEGLVANAVAPYVLGRPKVRASLTASASKYYYMYGGVRHPGIYRMGASIITLREALGTAGFFNQYQADKKRLAVITPDPVRPTYLIADGKEILMGGDKRNIVLKPGDVVFVQNSIIYDIDRALGILFRQTENVSTTNQVVDFWEDAVDGEFGEFTYPRDSLTIVY